MERSIEFSIFLASHNLQDTQVDFPSINLRFNYLQRNL